jgi:two-component system chemotaxis response regulator CheB
MPRAGAQSEPVDLPETGRARHRDTVVIGTSAGGLAALRTLLSQLPKTYRGSIFIVQHQSPSSAGHLSAALQSVSMLPVRMMDGVQHIAAGEIYVAPPNRHLVIFGDTVLATAGAREHRTRPAINPLFRTAAAARGSRTVGVLLTGTADDGVAGLRAIQRCGGITIVQDPVDAEFAELPAHALRALSVDHVLPLAKIAPLIGKLVAEPAPQTEIPADILIEAEFSGPVGSSAAQVDAIGEHTTIACPECGGPIWKVGDGGTAMYRCSIGHALSARKLLEEQADEVERALWVAVRTLDERATMLSSIARHAEERARSSDRERDAASEAKAQAELLRSFLLGIREQGSLPP